jgi:hypothetical protein
MPRGLQRTTKCPRSCTISGGYVAPCTAESTTQVRKSGQNCSGLPLWREDQFFVDSDDRLTADAVALRSQIQRGVV